MNVLWTRFGSLRGARAWGWLAGPACVHPAALAVVTVAVLPGCQPEEKIVRYKPFFSNVSGAQFGDMKPVNPNAGYVDPTVVSDNRIEIRNPDGSRRLIAKSVQHMLVHLTRCLDDGEHRLLLDQVVSQKTKDHYREMKKDPMELVEWLNADRKEVARTLARMPLAEHSPTVILEQPGDKTWVIKVTGAAARDLKYTRLWTRLEEGNWKFMWLE